jgi:DUF4097 and DUF4098 domain-containing protein YvlB
MSEERKLILKMLQENRINVDEAEQLLSALENKGTSAQAPREGSNLFDKAGPKVEQMMGTFSSLIDTVSHQLGPNLEKRFEGWFQQRAGGAGKESKENKESVAYETRSDESTIPVEAGSQKLRCFHRMGDIIVEGYDGTQIQAVLEKRMISQRVEDKTKFEEMRLHHRQEGAVLHLELQGAEGLKTSDGTVKLRLRIPTSLDLDLRTDSQDISLSQLSRIDGQVRLESESGNLDLRNIALKRLDLQTRSGNVSADQASELITIQTQSGDIKLKGSVYESQLSTASGQIQVEAGVNHLLKAESASGDLNVQLLDGRGRLDLRSKSGDIELTGQIQAETELGAVSGDLHCDLNLSDSASVGLSTQSGDVDLILRPGSQCKLEVSAVSGDIECRLDLQQRESSEHGLRGTLGSGEAQLKIQTQSGDVLIS